MQNKTVYYPNDYNNRETAAVNLDNFIVTKTLEIDLNLCPIHKVKDAVIIIGEAWNLRPNRPNEFKIIKKILLNSILYN